MISFNSKYTIAFVLLLYGVLQVSSCQKEKYSFNDLIPEAFDGTAEYVMNGEPRTSYANISHSRLIANCYSNISISDFSIGQPYATLSIGRIEFCESVGDTLPVISAGSENSQEPGVPIGKYSIYSGDLLASIYGPRSDTSHENYVVIKSIDEETGLMRASYKLHFTKSVGGEEFPPTLDIEGSVEAILLE